MRASWLEHSCLLASCVSLLFLIQGKRGLTRAVWVGWSARWHFLVLRAHPVFQLIIIQRETVNIKGCFAASEKCHTLAFIDTQLQEKRKKKSSECVHHDSCASFTLNWFLFPALTLLIFSVCPAVPSLPTVSQSVSVSVPLLSLLSCCQLFVLRLF